jgi:hypothetical protein
LFIFVDNDINIENQFSTPYGFDLGSKITFKDKYLFGGVDLFDSFEKEDGNIFNFYTQEFDDHPLFSNALILTKNDYIYAVTYNTHYFDTEKEAFDKATEFLKTFETYDPEKNQVRVGNSYIEILPAKNIKDDRYSLAVIFFKIDA